MALVCGMLGKRDPKAVRAMVRAMAHRGKTPPVVEDASHVYAGAAFDTGEAVLLDGVPRTVEGRALDEAALLAHCKAARDPSKLKLRGTFAAAVYFGADANRWWLIRDRLGAKPLYYFAENEFVVFASELKAILASGLVTPHLNLVSLDRYLTLRCVPGVQSIVQNVYSVQPGRVLEFHNGALTQHRFASFDLDETSISRPEAAERLHELLCQSTSACSAPALLWSGGLDSAALAASKDSVQPYFVLLEQQWQDEEKRARENAKRIRLPLEVLMGRRLNEETFHAAVAQLDEPLADPSVFPLWLVFEQAAKHTRTALTGHGADEVLGGYPRFRLLEKAGRGAKGLVPVSFLNGLAPVLPPNAFVRRASRYFQSIRDNLGIYLALVSVFDHDERNALYTDAMKSALHEHGGSERIMSEYFTERDLTRNLISLDINVGIPSALLLKCDRLAARHGLELQYPYLNDDLLDFALSLPVNVKYGVRSKPLLRLAMKGSLPGRVRLHARRGFRVPQEGRVMQVIDQIARTTITQDRVEATGLFKWSYVDQVVRSASHNIYRRRQFWALLMFFGWYRAVMER